MKIEKFLNEFKKNAQPLKIRKNFYDVFFLPFKKRLSKLRHPCKENNITVRLWMLKDLYHNTVNCGIQEESTICSSH